MIGTEVEVRLRMPHEMQRRFIESKAKRKVIRAGRRSGKTTGVAVLATPYFLNGGRVLYGAPTQEQVDSFWFELKRALADTLSEPNAVFYKNETMHLIELPGTKQRIRAKTCWNADTLRGDSASLLILDEYQLMCEDTWEVVGAPMLLDNNGDAVFIYTPPSLHSRSVSKARDPRHAAKLFKKAQADASGRWEVFHFTSHDNPYISEEALVEVAEDMSRLAYRQEILAEDVDESPGALWTRGLIEDTRRGIKPDQLQRIVVGVDPPGGTRNECGIVVAGIDKDNHGYILDDRSLAGTPGEWSGAVVSAYLKWKADRIIGEINYGGLMVEATILQAAKSRGEIISYKNVQASRGKAVRAEPVVAMYEHGKIHHAGDFPYLEDEMVGWVAGESRESPNRLDAMVWAITELLIGGSDKPFMVG